MDFSDSISLVEERGGVITNSVLEVEVMHHCGKNEVKAPAPKPRGRPRKRGARAKPNKLSVPKFIQLAEAVKEGGGNHLGRRRKGGLPLKTQIDNPITSDGISVDAPTCSAHVDVVTATVPFDPPGPILEVVLPPITNSSRSGIELLLQEGTDDNTQAGIQNDSEEVKLLQIQKQIGFCYNAHDGEVVKVLKNDEARDRLNKREWEQRNMSQ
jgi:hypothetical protein